jgi:cytochrome c oxidase cbb3-type subunit 3/ubiquinol-cytochrome c reductase cytochrome c subunit
VTPVLRHKLGAVAVVMAIALTGCNRLPGKPTAADHEPLASEVMAFEVLYARNCAGCHGTDGRLGAARPLNDALYLALVPRDRLRRVIAEGVPGTAQLAFAERAGGSLTDAQIDALVEELIKRWGGGQTSALPPYAATGSGAGDVSPGDPERGRMVFAAACAACHGADGKGGPKGSSIVDPSYLALVSDQHLRTTVIAGRTDLGMPDWRGYTPGQPLTAQQISDVVAWMVAQRRPVPGRLATEPRSPPAR